MSTSDETSICLYEELWTPPIAPFVFFLPMFYKYGVIVTDESLTFGYGFRSPGWIASKTMNRNDIDKDSIVTGNASWKDNFLKFGGWGIRLGLDGTTAYNAKNGDYIELVVKNESGKKQKYRFVSNDVEKVASLLRGEKVLEGED